MGQPKLIRDVLAEQAATAAAESYGLALEDRRIQALITKHLTLAMETGELDVDAFDLEMHPIVEEIVAEELKRRGAA